MKKILATTLIVAMGTSISMAAVINIGGDAADTFIGVNASGTPAAYWAGQNVLNTGDNNAASSQADNVAVLVFALPDLGGNAISTANLAIDIVGGWPSAATYPLGVDLYGVRNASSATVLTTDYAGIGNNVGNGTLLQDGVKVFASNTNIGWESKETDASGDAALAAWLTAQYTAGAGVGDFVFLRFNLDVSTANPIQIASADHASQATPVLTIETIPEPATIGLVAAISGAMLFIRRRFMI